MKLWFDDKKKNDNPFAITEDDIKVEESESDKSIRGQLNEMNTGVKSKLDFNLEHLNKYLVKSITNFLYTRYKQSNELCKKYLTESLYNKYIKELEPENEMFIYKDDDIIINSITLVDQNIESINYISDIRLEIDITVKYIRHNKYTEIGRFVIEQYKQKIDFKNIDNGWRISNYSARDFDFVDNEKIVYM